MYIVFLHCKDMNDSIHLCEEVLAKCSVHCLAFKGNS